MIKQLLLSFLILSVFLKASAQVPSEMPPIQPLLESLELYMEQASIAGVMLGVTTPDSVLFSGGLGYADLSTKKAVSSKTLFRMGSVTKMFVALGIMKLVENGHLSLSANLAEIAPEVPFENPWQTSHPLRVIHLLEHSSGFDDIKLNRLYRSDKIENSGFDMLMAHKNSMVCRWKPGERHAYSNPNYTVLGYLIEKLTGKSYDDYLKEIILYPLGMEDSHFHLGSKSPEKETREYAFIDGMMKEVESVTGYSGPPGSLWSNTDEMLKFLQMVLKRGDTLFTAESLQMMEYPNMGLNRKLGMNSGYGLGNHPSSPYGKFVFRGHSGLSGTCYSSCYYSRELGLAFVISTNSNHPNWQIEDKLITYLFPNAQTKIWQQRALDMSVMENYLGRYQFDSPRNEISAFADRLKDAPRVKLKNGKLFLHPLLGNPRELFQTDSLSFRIEGQNHPYLKFGVSDEGAPCMWIAGRYYEKVSNFWAISKRLLLVLGVAIATLSIFQALMALVLKIRKRINNQVFLAGVLPVIGSSALLLGVLKLQEIQQYTFLMYELDFINNRTLTIFGGTSLFGLSALFSLFFTLKNFRNIDQKWLLKYLLVTSLTLCGLTLYLWQQGWIGMRTWAM